MRWDCGPSPAERFAALLEWHPFFALWPRRVGSHDCRWLEWIERKGTFDAEMAQFGMAWDWEYRARQT